MINHALYKKLVHWFLLLLAVHTLALLVYSFFLNTTVSLMVYDGILSTAYATLLGFEAIVYVIFILLHIKAESSLTSFQNEIRQAIKDPNYTTFGYYKKVYLKEHLLKIAIYAVFQIPLTLSFALQGLMFVRTTILERVYVLDWGGYVVTGSAILGFLLNLVLLGAILMGLYLMMLYKTKRDIETF